MAHRSRSLTWMIFGIFFVISLLSNIVGPLVPEIIRSFGLSLTLAAFLPFCFFGAYAVMSLPAGLFTERFGEKTVILSAFGLAFAGSILFSLMPAYPTALLSLFLIGLGMAALQVALNPLLRVAGGEENYAFNAVVGETVFGFASFLSPLLYSHFAKGHYPAAFPWVAIYWLFSFISGAALLVIAFVRFPRVVRAEAGAVAAHLELMRRPLVWAYFLGIFSYVGIEQGLNNWTGQFLQERHGIDPATGGALAVSHFWLLMTCGALFGLVLLKFFDSRRVLILFTTASIAVFTAALFGSALVSYYSFSALGFTVSVLWPILFSLALNSVDKHHQTFAGLLCTGVVGGALFPLLIGFLGDCVGLRAAMLVLYLPLTYVALVGFWAQPLITNKRSL